MYPIRLAREFRVEDRDWICEAMLRKGIGTGRYFAPLHQQPVVQAHPFLRKAKEWGTQPKIANTRSEISFGLSQTEFVAERVIALPFFNELTEREIQEVCGALEESVRELCRKM